MHKHNKVAVLRQPSQAHRENKHAFRQSHILKNFEELIDDFKEKGFEYDADAFKRQWQWLRRSYYKTPSGSSDKPKVMKIFSDATPDCVTHSQEIHGALIRKYPYTLHPIVSDYAIHFLLSTAGNRYEPSSSDLFVEIDGSLFRNSYIPPLMKPTEKLLVRPKIWAEYLNRIMPPLETCTLPDGSVIKQQEYFEAWVAQRVQTPDQANNVVVVLRGEQGTGKGFWADVVLPPLIGASNYKAIALDQIKGKEFVKPLYKTTLLHIEEINDTKAKTTQHLKRLATQGKIEGRDPFEPLGTLEKKFGLFLSSNFPDPIKVENIDRRYFIPCFSRHLVNNNETPQFYSSFFNWLEESDGYQQMLNYLSSIDLSQYSFRSPPLTNDKLELMEHQTVADQKVEQASMELKYSYSSHGFKLVEVQNHWGLSEYSARKALTAAGFYSKQLRWQEGQDKTRLWIHKTFDWKENKMGLELFSSRNNHIFLGNKGK